MRRWSRRLLAASATLLVSMASMPAGMAQGGSAQGGSAQSGGAGTAPQPSGDQLDAARALANAGLELYQRGEWAASLDRFEQAERIFHAPSHLLFIARARTRLGKLVAARDAYQQLLAETLAPDAPKVFVTDQAAGKKELAELLPRIGQLTITVANPPPDARAVIDGREARLGENDVDPGARVVVVTAPGFERAERRVEVSEGGQLRVDLALVPLPEDAAAPAPPPTAPPADQGSDVVAWAPAVAFFAVGAGGLAMGGITGAMALGKASDLDEACPDRAACPRENEALEDDGRSLATLSTVGFVVGGVGVAAGAAWLLFWPSDDDEGDVVARPFFDGQQLGVTMSF